ncbi:uncharacterized protein C8Q71DRAFT_863688 [Rhodofomes roseus]|uniref:Uncharacterized protein n=1 Tax=Rhodofomes roseus TaxID=34475 RepID=A0ABQ8JXK2_9APHY|nr:uncharacterized protein C8Q71DRAFT_863688 [Rhodofomes roseus]KAH9828832.1 hypothetical protein C8Q71DRAFT_863688 [Rhodofomes roseus]
MAQLRAASTPPRTFQPSINLALLHATSEHEAHASRQNGASEDADFDMNLNEPSELDIATPVSTIDPALSGSVGDTLRALQERTISARSDMRFLEPVANMFRLKGEAKAILRHFIEAPSEEREIILLGAVMSVKQAVESNTVVANELWTVSDRLETEIDKYAIRILLSPEIKTYDQGPLDQLATIIKRKRWGLSATIEHDDDGKWDKVLGVARGRLTQRKSEIKKAVGDSYDAKEVASAEDDVPMSKGQNIIGLCKVLQKIGIKKIPSGTNINMTPQFCARIAFLRSVHFEHGTSDSFWKQVDEELISTRKEAKYDNHIFSYHMTQVLERDRKLFPCLNWNTIDKNMPSTSQSEVDQVLQTGSSTTLTTAEDISTST